MDSNHLAKVIQAYEKFPLSEGDVLLLADKQVATEVAGLADAWDPTLRRNLVSVIAELGVREVQVAVARANRQLLPRDHDLQAELREDLGAEGTVVHPLIALPAA